MATTTAGTNALGEGLRTLGTLGLASISGLTRLEIDGLRAFGLRRLKVGRLREAADVLDYLCFLEPDRAEAWDAVAAVRLADGKIEEGCAAVEAAAALEPTWGRAAIAARCRALAGDAGGAAAWTTRARALADKAGVARTRVARALAAATEDGR